MFKFRLESINLLILTQHTDSTSPLKLFVGETIEKCVFEYSKNMFESFIENSKSSLKNNSIECIDETFFSVS